MVAVICSAPKDLIAVFWVVVAAGGGQEKRDGFGAFSFPLDQPLPDAGFGGGPLLLRLVANLSGW